MRETKVYKLVLSALFLALGIVMPFLTAQIPEVGSMLLPMHIPVLICGFACGWQYGLVVGLVVPVLRSMMYTMPPMFPTAVCMAFELAAYGGITGLIYGNMKNHDMKSVYLALIVAMIGGRIVWGVARLIFAGVSGNGFTAGMFLAGAFTTAVPGIILQLVLVPIVVVGLRRARVIR